MNCNDAMNLLTESLAGPLPVRAAAELEAHLAACAPCRAEAESLRRIWEELQRLPEELPGEEMTQRFAAVLAPHLARSGAAAGSPATATPAMGTAAPAGTTPAGTTPAAVRTTLRRRAGRLLAAAEDWLYSLQPRRPLAQGALTLAVLALGVWIGAQRPLGPLGPLGPDRLGAAGRGAETAAAGGEIGALRAEVHSLSQLVTLSLLKQDSASERLRGVSFGRQSGATDERVLAALLETLRRDRDVNVRLAAIDALAPTVGRPLVRDQLLDEMARQPSPMVQIALIDVLLAHDRAGSLQRLQDLAADSAIDPTVRGYLRSRLDRIS